MPRKGPRAKCNQCNINMLANQEPKASALFWYTQRYHTLVGMVRGPRTAVRYKKPQGPVPRSATFDPVYWRLVGWPWGAFTDRGPWAMFLGNVSRRGGLDHSQAAFQSNSRSNSHGKQASPLQTGARSTGKGFRVGVVGSLGKSFVWGAKLRIA